MKVQGQVLILLTGMLLEIRRKLNPIFIQILICITAISYFVIRAFMRPISNILTNKALGRVSKLHPNYKEQQKFEYRTSICEIHRV